MTSKALAHRSLRAARAPARAPAPSPAPAPAMAIAITAIAVAVATLAVGGAATPAFAADAAKMASYVADPAASKLEFIGVQAGAEFKGVFHKFTANVDFDPAALGASHIDVQIDMSSADTMDKDRDTTMRGSDVFDVAHFPTAHYVTHNISKTATGFAATGALTLHGVTQDVPIAFIFTQASGAAKLDGSATLNRLTFGVGQGDWKSTEWVKDPVKVNFSLSLKPKP